MPGLDRTGPEGQGSRTGREMGKCTSRSEAPSIQDRDSENERVSGLGRGLGRGPGKGRGRGLGRGFGRGRSRGLGRGPGKGNA
jgi:hypothetical protein